MIFSPLKESHLAVQGTENQIVVQNIESQTVVLVKEAAFIKLLNKNKIQILRQVCQIYLRNYAFNFRNKILIEIA
jgi:hypothetical protein